MSHVQDMVTAQDADVGAWCSAAPDNVTVTDSFRPICARTSRAEDAIVNGRNDVRSAELNQSSPELAADFQNFHVSHGILADDDDTEHGATSANTVASATSTTARLDSAPIARLDLFQALERLHSDDEGMVRNTLRDIHVALRHGSASRMLEVLRLMGAPEAALSTIPTVVSACAS